MFPWGIQCKSAFPTTFVLEDSEDTFFDDLHCLLSLLLVARFFVLTVQLHCFGFEPRDAARAHAFLVNNVVGYVHQEMGTRAQAAGGSTPTYTLLAETLKAGADSLPTLSALNLDDDDFDLDSNFRYFVNYTIGGIAARPGAPAADPAAID